MVLKKIAITGASGMLGHHFLYKLKQMGIKCYSISRNAPSPFDNSDMFVWNSLDLNNIINQDEFEDYFPNVDAIIHIAALVPVKNSKNSDVEIYNVNVRSTELLGQWANKKNIPFVFISGSTVYKNPHGIKIFEDDTKLDNKSFGGSYGFSKLLAERSLEKLKKQGLKVIIIRPSSIYGHKQTIDKLVPNFFELNNKNSFIELYEPYDDKINLIHACDVVTASINALFNNSWGTFNIAFKKEYSIKEIAKSVIKTMGYGSIKFSGNKINKQHTTRYQLDCSLAKNTFNFDPVIDISKGMLMILNKEFILK